MPCDILVRPSGSVELGVAALRCCKAMACPPVLAKALALPLSLLVLLLSLLLVFALSLLSLLVLRVPVPGLHACSTTRRGARLHG